jgi:beta-lactamase regulating signal transducer with metallopeptidase domain
LATRRPAWQGREVLDVLKPAGAALVIMWIIGSGMYALVQAVRIRRMTLLAQSARGADASLTARVAQLAHRLGMRPIGVRVVEGLDSPLVFSAGRPTLLWPGGLGRTVGESSIEGLIVHELAHVRRRDHWVGWLELLAGVAWWWNPLFWYVRHQVRENAELACDGWVVDTLPAGRRAYAEALLSVCECISSKRLPVPAPALGVGTGGREFLERRLKMILRDRVQLRLSRFGLAMIGLLVTSTLPAWSQKSATDGKSSGSGYTTSSLDPRVGDSLDFVATFGMSADALPLEAQQALAAYEQRKAEAQREMEIRMNRARSELTRQLKELQDRYTKAGRLDEAVSIRDRLRALEAGDSGSSAALPGMTGWTTRLVRPAQQPENLTMFRDRVGQTFTFHVVGSTDGNVWGKDVYTDDSSLAAAAVHAGVLRPGEAGEVRVTILPGREHYDGAEQHGVESRPYDAWPGSYRFGGEPTRPERPSTTDTYTPVREDPGTLEALHDRVGQTFTFEVTGATDGPIWGGADNVYTVDSNLATAAVHAGVLRPGERGAVTVTVRPDHGSYEGITRNGVESRSWGTWHGSYRIETSGGRPDVGRPREPRTY